ncbi:MAG TPA: group III truncated hemoglobin [Microvirga sp.]|jgi:hemoglobin|nr:group III truncated hemoglobin [Microvirga sp.]
MIPLAQVNGSAGLDDALIGVLVTRFYARIRHDPELGPVFERRLAGRWDAHLDTMVAFWSSVILRTGRYGGKPHAAHAGLGLDEAHFARWLGLFQATAREVLPADIAALFVDRAERIAESLQIGLGLGPKALHLPIAQPASGQPAP